ncbi:MAG TPA: hypothetical protein VH163_02035 [Gemmatimonadales bacterium]|nr:hypothetical protein [Gemmatimonadales bacterium]
MIIDLSQGTVEYNPLVVTVGFGHLGPLEAPLWWAVIHMGAELAFAMGCVALLVRDRDLVWFAIIGGWAIALLQGCDAFIGVFHLRFGLPLSALVYAIMAWRAASLLRDERPVPPGSLGTI